MKAMLPRSMMLRVGVVGLVSVPTGIARAQAIESDAEASRMVAALGDASWIERERATRELVERRLLDLSGIEQLVKAGEVGAEAVARLRSVASRLFAGRRMAGMGVQFAGFGPDGVQIEGTIDGFDAARVLQPGDVITGIEGERVITQDELRWEILSRDPGENLKLRLVRQGQEVEVSVRLGAFEELPAGQRPTSSDVANAFYRWWKRQVGSSASGAVVARELTIEDWVAIEAAGAAGSRWAQTRDSAARMVTFGGQARASLAGRSSFDPFAANGFRDDVPIPRVNEVAAIVERIRALSVTRSVLDERARTMERHADTAGDPLRREQLLAQRNEALQEIIQIDGELAALREALLRVREGLP